MAKTKQTFFVIFAGFLSQVAPATCYIALDASTTMRSSNAARFSSFAEAKAFAEANHITLTALTYIGRKVFLDSELSG